MRNFCLDGKIFGLFPEKWSCFSGLWRKFQDVSRKIGAENRRCGENSVFLKMGCFGVIWERIGLYGFFSRGWAAPSAIGAQWGRFDRTEWAAGSGCRGNACRQDRSRSDRQPAAAPPWRRAASLRRRPVCSAAGSLHKINRAAISGPQPPPGGGPQLASRRSASSVRSAGCVPSGNF